MPRPTIVELPSSREVVLHQVVFGVDRVAPVAVRLLDLTGGLLPTPTSFSVVHHLSLRGTRIIPDAKSV
jgi:hypothetical protein